MGRMYERISCSKLRAYTMMAQQHGAATQRYPPAFCDTRAHAYSKHRPNHLQAHTCTSHSSTSLCSLNHTPGGSCFLLLAPWTAAEASVLQLQEEQVPQIVSFPKHFSSLSSTLLPRLHRFLRHVSFTWVGDTVLWLPMM